MSLQELINRYFQMEKKKKEMAFRINHKKTFYLDEIIKIAILKGGVWVDLEKKSPSGYHKRICYEITDFYFSFSL